MGKISGNNGNEQVFEREEEENEDYERRRTMTITENPFDLKEQVNN